MNASAKLLVPGPPQGDQAAIVAAISEVKIQSSARNPTGTGFVPMDFGRLKVGGDLDLQLFGFDRDQVQVVGEAVAPGIVGALAVVNANDMLDPSAALASLAELESIDATNIVVGPADFEPSLLADKMMVAESGVFQYDVIDRKVVKSMVLKLLEVALEARALSSTR
jgi:signal recognition particle receptor subunit beta